MSARVLMKNDRTMTGAVRDIDVIGAGNVPLYAAGVTHRGPCKDGVLCVP